jgi:DNA-binding NarL/FixJ family response regulator
MITPVSPRHKPYVTRYNSIDIVGEGGSADDAIRIAREKSPDILLLDVRMPGGGIAAARAIARAYPTVKIIMSARRLHT